MLNEYQTDWINQQIAESYFCDVSSGWKKHIVSCVIVVLSIAISLQSFNNRPFNDHVETLLVYSSIFIVGTSIFLAFLLVVVSLILFLLSMNFNIQFSSGSKDDEYSDGYDDEESLNAKDLMCIDAYKMAKNLTSWIYRKKKNKIINKIRRIVFKTLHIAIGIGLFFLGWHFLGILYIALYFALRQFAKLTRSALSEFIEARIDPFTVDTLETELYIRGNDDK